MVQVHDDESLANDIGPEPCAIGGDANGEVLAGEDIGQPLSRESFNWDADAVETRFMTVWRQFIQSNGKFLSSSGRMF